MRHVTDRLRSADRARLLREHLDAWHRLRAEAPDADCYAVEARGAETVGLATLAAVCRALAELTTTPTPREARVLLQEIRAVALGEATLRVRRLLGETHPGVPGVSALPRTILESQYGASGRGRPPQSGRGGPR